MNKQPTWRGWPALLDSQLLALSGGTAQAQGGYPNKPVTLIALYSAGGDSELAARNFAAAQRALGVLVIVVNKPGASGVISSSQVIAARVDRLDSVPAWA